MDFLVSSPGLTCFPDAFAGDDFEFDMDLTCCSEAGEAAIVLNLFLARSDSAAFFVDITAGRVFRAVPGVLIGRGLFVVFLSTGLEELPVAALLLTDLLSISVVDARVDIRLVDVVADDTVGRAGDLVAVVPDIAIRFAAELEDDFKFSSEPLMSPLLPSSTELIEDLGLWPNLGALLAVTFVAGRLTLEVGVGRVGGLLRPLAGSLREIEDEVGFIVVLGEDIEVRFEAANSRLGGIPFLGGDFCAS